MTRVIFLMLSLVYISVNLVYSQYPEPFQENNKWGYKDSKGNLIVNAKYDQAEKFSTDFAIVQLNKKYGFINEKGVEIISPTYDKIENFRYGYAKVKADKKWGLIDTKGQIIISLKYDDLVQIYKEKYISVKLNEKWGVIDLKENILIPIEYDYSFYGEDGIFAAAKNDKAGFINIKNEVVIPFEYSNTEDFYDRIAEVSKGDSTGMIDKSGKVVIPIEFKSIEYYLEDYHLIIVRSNDDKIGVWFDWGEKIAHAVYSDYVELEDGYLILINSNIQCLLSPLGKFIIPCDVQVISEAEFDYDYLIFTKQGKLGLYDIVNNRLISDAIFDEYIEFDYYGNLILIRNQDKFGILNTNTGKVIIEPEYDEIEGADYGYFLVKKNNLYGLVNYNGEVVLPPKYIEIFLENAKTVGAVISETDGEPIYFSIKGAAATEKK